MNPLRDDGVTTLRCPLCTTPFTPVGRQQFCSHACRQAAYRRRRPVLPSAPVIPVTNVRRDITVYACDDCGQRYYAQQWCEDCNRPCRRVGIGGLCPHCDEPVAIDDLTTQHAPLNTRAVTHGPSA